MHFSLVYKGLECVDLKEKNRKQMCDQKKNIQSRVQKKSYARVDRVQKKRILDTQQFQIHGSEKN